MSLSVDLSCMFEGDDVPESYATLLRSYKPGTVGFVASGSPTIVPIDQVTPQKLRANLLGMTINDFGDFMPYWHFYPELIGYDRRGNGRVDGDATYFILSSVANAQGIGCIHIEFPPKRNSVDRDSNGGPLGAIDGLFHSLNRPFVRGYDVLVISEDFDVDFGAASGPRYNDQIAIVPATLLGLDVMFHAPADSRRDFLINRRVLWGDRAYDLPSGPSGPPAPPRRPVKDEL